MYGPVRVDHTPRFYYPWDVLRSRCFWLLAPALLALSAVHHFWPPFPSPNEWPRVYQALAVVHRGTLAIDDEIQAHDWREDMSSWGGHLYPNKAPGLLPLLLPGAWLAHILAHGPAELSLALYLGRILAVTLPWFFATLSLARFLKRRFPNAGLALVLALAYASCWFAYGGMLFAHGFSGAAVCAAVLLALGDKPSKLTLSASGFAMGWAVTAEYPLAVLAVLLGCAVVRQAGRSVFWFALGGIFPLLGLAYYNSVCFGAPWSLSTAHEVTPYYAALSQRGVFGIGLPTGSGLWLLLFSPERGLLFWAPVLLFGFLPPRGEKDVLSWFSWLASLAHLLLISGYPNADGGWCPGPRYLVASFPLLAVCAAAFFYRHWHKPWARLTGGVLALWSVPAAFLPLASFPLTPPEFPLGPASFHWPLLRDGVVAPGLWLRSAGPVLLLVAVVGLALCATAWLASWWLRALGVVAAFALWSPSCALSPLSFEQELELAIVRDVWAQGDGQWLARLKQQVASPAERKRLASWIWTFEANKTRTLPARRPW